MYGRGIIEFHNASNVSSIMKVYNDLNEKLDFYGKERKVKDADETIKELIGVKIGVSYPDDLEDFFDKTYSEKREKANTELLRLLKAANERYEKEPTTRRAVGVRPSADDWCPLSVQIVDDTVIINFRSLDISEMTYDVAFLWNEIDNLENLNVSTVIIFVGSLHKRLKGGEYND